MAAVVLKVTCKEVCNKTLWTIYSATVKCNWLGVEQFADVNRRTFCSLDITAAESDKDDMTNISVRANSNSTD